MAGVIPGLNQAVAGVEEDFQVGEAFALAESS